MICLGDLAKRQLEINLRNEYSSYCSGYFIENKIWVAFDNSSGNCWVEEFEKEEEAICWLLGYFEVFDEEERLFVRLNDNYILFPKKGALKLNYDKNGLQTQYVSF